MTRGTRPKHYFAAVPARALHDRRLDDGKLFHLLAAIAMHDRMSATNRGQGCWVGDRRLAADIGCHQKSIPRMIPKLCAWGYLEQGRLDNDKRKRVLRVIYTDADRACAGGEIGNTRTLPFGAEIGNGQTLPFDDEIGNTSEEIGNSTEQHFKHSRWFADHRIPEDMAPDFASPASVMSPSKEENSAEAASVLKDARHDVDFSDGYDDNLRREIRADHNQDARFLHTLQEWLKAGSDRPFTASEVRALENWRARCDEIWETRDTDDPLNGWAYRLCEELSVILYDYEQEVDA